MEGLSKLLSWFEKKERVLVVHLLRDGVHLHRCVVHPKRGVAECVPVRKEIPRVTDLKVAFKEVLLSSRGMWRFFRRHFIFVLDPGFATSVYGLIAVPRDRPKEVIVEADIENTIAQGIWKMFDGERVRAATKMGLAELDLVLSDVRVREVRLDGHRVLDPRGFTARIMAVGLLETLLPRSLLEAFRIAFPKEKGGVFIEGGVIAAHAFSPGAEKEEHLFVQIFSTVSDAFIVRGQSVVYADTVPWGARDLARAVSSSFLVSLHVAEEIISRSMRHELSPHLLRHVEKILTSACEDLARGLEKTAEHHGTSSVYLMPFSGFTLTPESRGRKRMVWGFTREAPAPATAFPEVIFTTRFRSRSGTRIRFRPVDYEERALFTGSAKPRAESSSSAWDFSTRAALAHFFFSPADDTLNKVARRRAGWLTDTLEKPVDIVHP